MEGKTRNIYVTTINMKGLKSLIKDRFSEESSSVKNTAISMT